MKLQLNESGLRNIKEISKEYKEAWIYGHIDFDGVTSSIIMKYYLAQYGIKTSNWIPMQYGSQEYASSKTPEGILGVLVDFSHGKLGFKIHTDHHQQQIQYPGQSKQFRHSKSNASTISSIISASDIMSKEDLKVIDMVDSAGYADEGLSIDEIKNYVFNYKKDSSSKENQLKFGIVVNKLLLAYKNKPDYLKTIVMESNPSLLSMYNVMMRMINQHVSAKDRGWSLPSVLQQNSENYQKNQEENIIKNGSVKTIDELSKGKNTVIGNCVVQIGGGNMRKSGSYDRYTAFKLHPDCKYFIMIWDTIGMMQVSTNNWNPDKVNDIDLGEIVLKQIFEGKYKPLLDKPKYDISILALKKCYEENILPENESNAFGFNLNDFRALFEHDLLVSEKQQKWLDTCMNYKPSQLTPNEKDTQKQREYKFKCCKFLNTFKIPLSEIILKTSGGHKTITNLNGFSFLEEQKRISKALSNKRNPYEKIENKKDTKSSDKISLYESTSLKILKSIAKDVVNRLNDKKISESVLKENDEGEIPTEGPILGYDTVFTYHGYDFSIEHLLDNDGSYYNVVVYKSNLTDDDEAYITEQILPSWIDVMKYARDFDSCKANRFRNSWNNDMKSEPEGDGSELNESVEELYDYEADIIGTEITNDDRTKYIITKLPEKDSDPEYFHIKEVDGDREILITKDELKKYLNFDVDDFIKNLNKDTEFDGSELNESILNETPIDDIDKFEPPELYDENTYTYGPYTYSIEYTDDGDNTKYFSVITYKKPSNDSRTNNDGNDIEEIDNVAFSTWKECINYMKSMMELYIIRKSNFMDRTATEPSDTGNEYMESVNKEEKMKLSDINETKASRFNKHLDDTEKSFAAVSAERSMPQINNREKQRYLNHKRTKVLEKLLKAWGLKGFIKTKGGFDEAGQPRVEINGNLSEEDSFFVPNITKEQAVRLGKLFNQDSVMFKEKGSNQVKELRTNTKAGNEGIGSETGLVFIVGQGRHNIGHDKTYYSRPKSSMIKFAFNPDDESK